MDKRGGEKRGGADKKEKRGGGKGLEMGKKFGRKGRMEGREKARIYR